jgi:hypothetical protein
VAAAPGTGNCRASRFFACAISRTTKSHADVSPFRCVVINTDSYSVYAADTLANFAFGYEHALATFGASHFYGTFSIAYDSTNQSTHVCANVSTALRDAQQLFAVVEPDTFFGGKVR